MLIFSSSLHNEQIVVLWVHQCLRFSVPARCVWNTIPYKSVQLSLMCSFSILYWQMYPPLFIHYIDKRVLYCARFAYIQEYRAAFLTRSHRNMWKTEQLHLATICIPNVSRMFLLLSRPPSQRHTCSAFYFLMHCKYNIRQWKGPGVMIRCILSGPPQYSFDEETFFNDIMSCVSFLMISLYYIVNHFLHQAH